MWSWQHPCDLDAVSVLWEPSFNISTQSRFGKSGTPEQLDTAFLLACVLNCLQSLEF